MASSKIWHIGTLTPECAYTQDEAAAVMQDWTNDARAKRLIRRIYRTSGIDTRYSVIRDFKAGEEPNFLDTIDGQPSEPSTGKRNDIFGSEGDRLAVKLGRQVFADCPTLSPTMVTHLITVTCTGFTNPGADYAMIRELGLPENVQRYHLGFMGCYAAFPALRMAHQFCQADPRAVVMIVGIELCSLHLQFEAGLDSVLANSLFSDGLAAAVVSARPPPGGTRPLALDGFSSRLIDEGENDMAWRIGDNGFAITLSSYVPKIIAANVDQIVAGILEPHGLSQRDIGVWAVHPGGKSIVDKVQSGLGLADEQVCFSRNVLRDYGNMSSVTILFVLEQIMQQIQPEHVDKPICAMSFGPGLTVESALLQPGFSTSDTKAAAIAEPSSS